MEVNREVGKGGGERWSLQVMLFGQVWRRDGGAARIGHGRGREVMARREEIGRMEGGREIRK